MVGVDVADDGQAADGVINMYCLAAEHVGEEVTARRGGYLAQATGLSVICSL